MQIRATFLKIFIVLSFLAGNNQLQGQEPSDLEISRMELLRDSLIGVKTQLELRIISLSDSISKRRIEKASQGVTTRAVLIKDSYLREDPNNFSRPIFSVKEGDSVEVLDADPEFLKCLFRGEIGYIAIDYINRDENLVNFYLMKQVEREKEDSARIKEFQLDFVRPYKEKGAGLTIWNIDITDINSANGVSFRIEWAHLIPDKTVKYVDFYVTPFNAVGDVVNCELRGNRQFKGRVTGPISFHYGTESSEWENAWYNNTVRCIRLDQVNVYYTDGSNYTYIKELPKLYRGSFENDCRY